MTTYSIDTSVGQFVAERPSRAKIFEKYGIDYCCGGKLPLKTLAVKKGLDPEAILAEIAAFDAGTAPETAVDWREASLTDLANHIVKTHHQFLREAMPRLAFLVDKVARVHGQDHPELIEVAGVYHAFRMEMEMHMAKEEQVLFPLIMRLELEGATAMPLDQPISVMESEHDSAGRALERLRELTGDFQPPVGACNSYRAMLDGLHEVEQDTHEHIHKENNILFLRAIALMKAGAGA